jgi:hypothetical protein
VTLTKTINRKRAERLYFQISDDAGDIRDQLYTATDPGDRAYLLNQLADHEQQLADLHPAAFGADPNEDEGGRDLAESLASSATLIRALAATEDGNVGRLNRLLGTIDITESILWRRLASTRNRNERADLIGQVAEHAAMRVGGQAAEPLACLAHTERELALAAVENRPPSAPKTPKALNRSRAVIAGALLTAAVAVELPDLLSLIH